MLVIQVQKRDAKWLSQITIVGQNKRKGRREKKA
jgi:hypothetical protein